MIDTCYGPVRINVHHYRNGDRIAINLVEADTGEPVTVLTVNLPSANNRLGNDEIFVKTWSENAPLVEPLLASGLFEDTGRREPTGLVEASVWRLTEKFFRTIVQPYC